MEERRDRVSVEPVGEPATRGENVRPTFDMIPLNRAGTCPPRQALGKSRARLGSNFGEFRPKVIFERFTGFLRVLATAPEVAKPIRLLLGRCQNR